MTDSHLSGPTATQTSLLVEMITIKRQMTALSDDENQLLVFDNCYGPLSAPLTWDIKQSLLVTLLETRPPI